MNTVSVSPMCCTRISYLADHGTRLHKCALQQLSQWATPTVYIQKPIPALITGVIPSEEH